MENEKTDPSDFWARVCLAWRMLVNRAWCERVLKSLRAQAEQERLAAIPVPPERTHASALMLLAALQREGRLIDFLQQEVASYSDAEIGAGARVIHAGCRKVLADYLSVQPVMRESEGATVTVNKDFDPRRIQLTGKIPSQAPFRGTLKHHGWVTSEIRLPSIAGEIDSRVLAPAEVEPD